jgi:hypothetical protein
LLGQGVIRFALALLLEQIVAAFPFRVSLLPEDGGVNLKNAFHSGLSALLTHNRSHALRKQGTPKCPCVIKLGLGCASFALGDEHGDVVVLLVRLKVRTVSTGGKQVHSENLRQ